MTVKNLGLILLIMVVQKIFKERENHQKVRNFQEEKQNRGLIKF
jgi:hypothetical protein